MNGIFALPIQEEESYQNFHALHHDSTGIICVSQILEGKWSNRYGRYQAMHSYIQELESQDEIFFSQNTFKKFRRSTEHLFELKALYIDLDFHKHTNLTKEQALGSIEMLVREKWIPEPTYIIDSGYGLNLIWRIKRIPAQALPLWRTIEEYLYTQLEPYGADRKALDATRVFRIEGTYNAKYSQKNKVNIISSNAVEYDIHLIQDYVHFERSKKKRVSTQNRTIVRLFNRYSLYYSRYIDILAICKLREYEMTGYRETVLFLYRYYGCAYLSDNELALQNALDLNSRFTEPLAEREVIRATKSAEKAAAKMKYGYRNQTLIQLLDITDEEMAYKNSNGDYALSSIISKAEKYRRNNQRRYHKIRNKEGQTQEEVRQLSLLEQVVKLRAEGLTQNEVAKRLEISIRTVQKYEKKYREAQGNLK